MALSEISKACAALRLLERNVENLIQTNQQWITDWKKLSYKDKVERTLEEIKQLIAEAEKENKTNEQWFIDWLDKINELSVAH